jgi:signal transduction histidine kinase
VAKTDEMKGAVDPRSAALLADMGIALVEAGDLGRTLQRLAHGAREISGARYAAIGVLDGPGDGLAEFITSGIDDETRARIGAPPKGRGLLGAIIEEQAPVLVDEISEDPRSGGFPDGHPPMSSFLGVPIRLGPRIYGNIYVTDAEEGSFSKRHVRLLETLAAYAAIAIRGAELREERQRWIEGLEGICGISGSLGMSLELSEILPEAARRTRALLDCDTVGIALWKGGRLTVPFAHGRGALQLEALDSEPADLGEFTAIVESALAPVQCHAAVLEAEGQELGVLAAVSRAPLDKQQREVVEILAQHVAAAVSHAQSFAEQRRHLTDESARHAVELEERLAREAQARALLAQENERARVARELHDETGQLLTGVGLRLKALASRVDPAAARELEELREHVREVQGSMRQVLRRLRPVNLEHGLGVAISELAERATESSGCRINVDIGPLPPIDEEVELVLFRVSQEALTNVARHSGASRASVLMSSFGSRVRLTVEDDGRGFDPQARTDRMGLAGIAERVGLVGGELRIDSAPDGGTAIVVDLSAAIGPQEEAST